MSTALSDTSDNIVRFVRKLTKRTDSDVVILRKPRFEESSLELVDYSISSNLKSNSFAVPTQKSFIDWGNDDPITSWGFSGPGGQRCPTYGYTPQEKEFVNWIKQKAWYPVVCPKGKEEYENLLIVLLRGDEREYCKNQVALDWLTSQLSIFEMFEGEHEQAAQFVEAISFFEDLPIENSIDDIKELIARSLSVLGIPWVHILDAKSLSEERSVLSSSLVCNSGDIEKSDFDLELDRVKFLDALPSCKTCGDRNEFELLSAATPSIEKALVDYYKKQQLPNEYEFFLYMLGKDDCSHVFIVGSDVPQNENTGALIMATCILEYADQVLESHPSRACSESIDSVDGISEERKELIRNRIQQQAQKKRQQGLPIAFC